MIAHDQNDAKRELYDDSETLKKLISKTKFQLDCGHVVTFGHNLGTTAVIINGAVLEIICSSCYD
jgi:hypothetical protein